MRKHATIASTHSGRLPTSVITTSPRRTPRAAQRRRRRAPSRGHLAERPLAPAAVARQLDQGPRARRRGVDDVAGEVHGSRARPIRARVESRAVTRDLRGEAGPPCGGLRDGPGPRRSVGSMRALLVSLLVLLAAPAAAEAAPRLAVDRPFELVRYARANALTPCGAARRPRRLGRRRRRGGRRAAVSAPRAGRRRRARHRQPTGSGRRPADGAATPVDPAGAADDVVGRRSTLARTRAASVLQRARARDRGEGRGGLRTSAARVDVRVRQRAARRDRHRRRCRQRPPTGAGGLAWC